MNNLLIIIHMILDKNIEVNQIKAEVIHKVNMNININKNIIKCNIIII
jgi:hypothetical protein